MLPAPCANSKSYPSSSTLIFEQLNNEFIFTPVARPYHELGIRRARLRPADESTCAISCKGVCNSIYHLSISSLDLGKSIAQSFNSTNSVIRQREGRFREIEISFLRSWTKPSVQLVSHADS